MRDVELMRANLFGLVGFAVCIPFTDGVAAALCWAFVAVMGVMLVLMSYYNPNHSPLPLNRCMVCGCWFWHPHWRDWWWGTPEYCSRKCEETQ